LIVFMAVPLELMGLACQPTGRRVAAEAAKLGLHKGEWVRSFLGQAPLRVLSYYSEASILT
jgi:hypothetical protein